MGRLTKEQRDQIRHWSFALPDTEKVWLAYRQQRQQELLTLLHHHRTPKRAAQELRTIFSSHDHTMSAPYHEAVCRMRERTKTMVLPIDQQITPEQRRHAVVKLQRFIDQINDLQAG